MLGVLNVYLDPKASDSQTRLLLLLCRDFLGLGFRSILMHYTARIHFTLFEMKDLSSTPHS